MLRRVFTLPLLVCTTLASLLAACTALPDLAVVLDAVTFVHDERSGHRGDFDLKMALIPALPRAGEAGELASQIKASQEVLSRSDRQTYFRYVQDLIALRQAIESIDPGANPILDEACTRSFRNEIDELRRMREGADQRSLPFQRFSLPGLTPPELIISAGQLAYSLVIGHLQSKIKKLEEESQATYSFKQARIFNWPALRCAMVWRQVQNKAKSGKTEADMLLLLGRQHMADANALRILYVRVNRAIAKTATGTEQKPASIQLDVAISVFAAHVEKGKPVVSQLTHQVFRPLSKVVLGKPTSVCVEQNSPFATSCNMQSELFPNPPLKASAFSVGIAVTETGSALGQAARANASLKSLDALVKPKFEAILKQVAAEATK